jgi:hypothetical protein
MLFFLIGGLLKDMGDLLIAFFFGLRSKIGVAVTGL